MAEPVQIEVTTTTVKHTVISGKWRFIEVETTTRQEKSNDNDQRDQG